MKVKDVLIMFVLLSFVGVILEWAYGTLWSLCGETPWIYPNSILRYSSFEVFPMWGLGGLITLTIYRAYSSRNWKIAVWIIAPLALAALWVLFYDLAIQ